jgi:general secretion pathway protein K
MSPPLAPRRRRPGRPGERGVALIIAVVAITLLTVVATDFAYNTRVDLQLATNQRDELRAHYLAQSGVGMSRLLLRFQKQLNSIQIPALPIPGMPPGGGGLNLQIWKMARVDCHMLQGMVNSTGGEDFEENAPQPVASGFDDEFPEQATKQRQKSFGGFEGCFLSTITDEEEKLNLHKLYYGLGEAPRQTAARMVDLMSDKRFEFLFEREDANGDKPTPQDVVVALRDWMDPDEGQAGLNLTQGGEAFPTGFASESGPYDGYEPRYKPKNARFDSLDELYRVYGVNDRFMAAFRDRFTVYPAPNRQLNINTDDPLLLYMAILSVVNPLQAPPQLQNPVFVQDLINQIRMARQLSVLGMSTQSFLAVLQAARLPINPAITANPQNSPIGDKSETFRITSVGEAGNVQKTVHAVVRLDDALGKLLYWREE